MTQLAAGVKVEQLANFLNEVQALAQNAERQLDEYNAKGWKGKELAIMTRGVLRNFSLSVEAKLANFRKNL